MARSLLCCFDYIIDLIASWHTNSTITQQGELIAVCGSVGTGKSSFISALLGHMRLQSGEVYLQGTCAYVGQQAWIMNASFRENILMGEAFDAKRWVFKDCLFLMVSVFTLKVKYAQLSMFWTFDLSVWSVDYSLPKTGS